MVLLSSGHDGNRFFWRGFQLDFCQNKKTKRQKDKKTKRQKDKKTKMTKRQNYKKNVYAKYDPPAAR